MRITYILRKPRKGQQSIERVFNVIKKNLNEKISVNEVRLPYYSSGLLNVFRNIKFLRKPSAGIFHITGDVHYAALALPQKSTLLTIHDVGSILKGNWLSLNIKKWLWFTLPIRKCAYISVISEFSKGQLMNIVDYPKERIVVVPNPIPSGFEYSPPKEKNEKPVLLQVGTKENKNLLRLIEAIASIDCKLIVVGTLSHIQINMLSKYEIDYENYTHIPDQELISLFKLCDILCYVSTYEGFGMPIIEAQSIGRPVLTSNIPPIKEISGNAVHFVDPLSIQSIQDGLKELMSNKNLRENLIKSGIENAKRYQAKEISEQYAQLYKKLEPKSA